MDAVIIEARRYGGTPEQCGETLTVSELIELLAECGDPNTPVYISNDKGFTYGPLREQDVARYGDL